MLSVDEDQKMNKIKGNIIIEIISKVKISKEISYKDKEIIKTIMKI